jgi:hypothetical protein
MARPVSLRKHAILKHHYRRAVASTADFHSLSLGARWLLLRDQILMDSTPAGSKMLDIFNSREPRQAEVIAALEEGRQEHMR